MSILGTYGRTSGAFGDPALGLCWPLDRLNDDFTVDKESAELRPGDWVAHASYGGRGLVVAVTDDEVAVLWSIDPREPDFVNFILPKIQRSPSLPLCAKNLTSIQPMPVPSSAIFYVDYTYGKADGAKPDAVPPPDSGLPEPDHRTPRRPGRPTRGPRKNS